MNQVIGIYVTCIVGNNIPAHRLFYSRPIWPGLSETTMGQKTRSLPPGSLVSYPVILNPVFCQPASNLFHGDGGDLQLVLFATAHHFLVEAAGFVLGLDLFHGVAAQLLQGLYPLFGYAGDQEGFFTGGALGFGFGFGFHLRETWDEGGVFRSLRWSYMEIEV
jgi:hypothetical protein